MISPFLVLYFLDIGLSYFKISLVTSALGLSMAVFELPTGALADGFSRKVSVVVGFFIIAVAAAMIPLTHTFAWLLAAWVVMGFGMTFISGAQVAWIIDNLTERKRTDLSHEFFIKNSSIMSLSSIVAPILGTLVVKYYSMKMLWFSFAIGALVCAVLLLFLTKEDYRPPQIRFRDIFTETLKNSWNGLRFTVSNRTVFLLMIAQIFIGLMLFGNMGEQPYLVSLGMLDYQLGYMYSIIAVVGLGTPFMSRLFVGFNPRKVVSVVILFRTALFFVLNYISYPLFILAAILIILRNGLFSFVGPISENYFQKFILKENRSTILSIRSMVTQLFTSIVALASGVFLDLFGAQKVLAFGGLFGIFAVFFYTRIKD